MGPTIPTAPVPHLPGAARGRVSRRVGRGPLGSRGGGCRLGAGAGLGGELLILKVTMSVDEGGAFAPLGGSRGEKAGLQDTMDGTETQMGGARKGRFAVGHGLSEERAHRIADSIRERWDVTELVVYDAGSVVCTHTGTCWGVAVWPEG